MKKEIDKFYLMRVFQTVSTYGTFTAAAQHLGITVSAVSKAVKQLESSLETSLLHRTTRSQSLTDAGREYLDSSQQILTQFSELEERIKQKRNEPSGLLRISAPTALGQFVLAPAMGEFLNLFPQIRLELVLTEALLDITEQGIDVAIRSRALSSSSQLYSKILGTRFRKLVAAPKYIANQKMPVHPDELTNLTLLNYVGTQVESHWQFRRDSETITVQPEARYCSNNYDALHKAALSGTGVANLYSYLVDEDINRGQLVQLLPDWEQQKREIYAIYQQRQDLSPKLEAFINFLSGLTY